MHWRAPIPYPVRFDFVVDEVAAPWHMAGRASGDLDGRGVWRLFEEHGVTAVTYQWDVRTTRRLMNVLAPVAQPLFVRSHDRIMRDGGEALARRLGARLAVRWIIPPMGRLDSLDLSLKLSRQEEADRLEAGHARLSALRLKLGGKLGDGELGPPVCALFEGWDASGKGGAIKRLVQPLDLRHVRVAQFAAPTFDEKRHHFLWRFWPVLPGWGGMAVLDRSWYGRVLVERVEGFATMDQWERAYDEIVQFEKSLCLEGMILIKFWIHLSEDEQLKRFKKREGDPLKQWKLTDEDWRNREKRPAYEQAVEDMLARTDHELSHWQLIEGDSKRWARVKVLETVIAEVESGMRERGFAVPDMVAAGEVMD